MLARDQLKLIAQEIDKTADLRMHDCGDAYDRQQLWEVVRRASHAIAAVADLERDSLTPTQRERRANYLVAELEIALDAARRAKIVMDWTARD
jgi:hypothetical protein